MSGFDYAHHKQDSTALATSLPGLRGVALILNLRYPQPRARRFRRGMIGYPAKLRVCLCVPILPGRDFSAQAFHRNQAN